MAVARTPRAWASRGPGTCLPQNLQRV